MPRWRTKRLRYKNNAREYTSEFGSIVGETPEGLPTLNGWVLLPLPPGEAERLAITPSKKRELIGESAGLLGAGPASADLSEWDTPIFTQELGDCVANAACGAFQWLQKRRTGDYWMGSRLFVYKEGRDYEGVVGDEGMFPKDAIWCLQTEGVCREELWPYNIANVNVEPPLVAFQDAYAHKATSLIEVGDGQSGMGLVNAVRDRVQTVVVPFACIVYANFAPDAQGRVPYPSGGVTGGHAMVVMGYNDNMQNMNGSYGAFFVRNSWGLAWGWKGYCWMGYDYFGNTEFGAAYYGDLYAVLDETGLGGGGEEEEGGGGEVPIPEGTNVGGGLGVDIYPYLVKAHNGMATSGLHKIEIHPVDGKAIIDMSVRVRRHQEGLQ